MDLQIFPKFVCLQIDHSAMSQLQFQMQVLVRCLKLKNDNWIITCRTLEAVIKLFTLKPCGFMQSGKVRYLCFMWLKRKHVMATRARSFQLWSRSNLIYLHTYAKIIFPAVMHEIIPVSQKNISVWARELYLYQLLCSS